MPDIVSVGSALLDYFCSCRSGLPVLGLERNEADDRGRSGSGLSHIEGQPLLHRVGYDDHPPAIEEPGKARRMRRRVIAGPAVTTTSMSSALGVLHTLYIRESGKQVRRINPLYSSGCAENGYTVLRPHKLDMLQSILWGPLGAHQASMGKR